MVARQKLRRDGGKRGGFIQCILLHGVFKMILISGYSRECLALLVFKQG